MNFIRNLHPVRRLSTWMMLPDQDPERGSTTVEYVIGILLIVALGGVIFSIVTGGAFNDIIFTLIRKIVQAIEAFLPA